jgi:hypothetical protein
VSCASPTGTAGEAAVDCDAAGLAPIGAEVFRAPRACGAAGCGVAQCCVAADCHDAPGWVSSYEYDCARIAGIGRCAMTVSGYCGADGGLCPAQACCACGRGSAAPPSVPDGATQPADCNGVPGGGAILDACGQCGGSGFPPGTCSCDGLAVDECGTCGGSGIPPGDCDCEGNQLDCSGICGGTAIKDVCLVCGGDGTRCHPASGPSLVLRWPCGGSHFSCHAALPCLFCMDHDS